MMFSETKPLKSSSDGPSPSKNREESHPNHSNNMFPKSTGMDKLILLAGLISKLRSRRLAVGGPPGGGVVQADTEDRSAQLPAHSWEPSFPNPSVDVHIGKDLLVPLSVGAGDGVSHAVLLGTPEKPVLDLSVAGPQGRGRGSKPINLSS